jgi:hypothetical protein
MRVDSVKKERNHTENRASRRRADTTPTKGSSNDDEGAYKSGDFTLLLNQSDVRRNSSSKEKAMFSS